MSSKYHGNHFRPSGSDEFSYLPEVETGTGSWKGATGKLSYSGCTDGSHLKILSGTLGVGDTPPPLAAACTS